MHVEVTLGQPLHRSRSVDTEMIFVLSSLGPHHTREEAEIIVSFSDEEILYIA